MSDIPIHGSPDQILAFCKAFRKMQPKIPAFPRTREGQEGNRKFNYTEYDKVLEIVEPIFDEHGFFHFQNRNTVEGPNGPMATVDSFLLHESGAYSHAHNEARVEPKNAIREAGKAHTYFSRYGLIGLIGKTSETDQDAPESPPQQTQRTAQGPPKQQAKPSAKTPPNVAQSILDEILEFVDGCNSTKEDRDDMMKAIAAHSKDVHGMKPSELAKAGASYKLDEVLRWTKSLMGESEPNVVGPEDFA